MIAWLLHNWMLACAGAAILFGLLMLMVLALCKAASATDDYLDRIRRMDDPDDPYTYS